MIFNDLTRISNNNSNNNNKTSVCPPTLPGHSIFPAMLSASSGLLADSSIALETTTLALGVENEGFQQQKIDENSDLNVH